MDIILFSLTKKVDYSRYVNLLDNKEKLCMKLKYKKYYLKVIKNFLKFLESLKMQKSGFFYHELSI